MNGVGDEALSADLELEELHALPFRLSRSTQSSVQSKVLYSAEVGEQLGAKKARLQLYVAIKAVPEPHPAALVMRLYSLTDDPRWAVSMTPDGAWHLLDLYSTVEEYHRYKEHGRDERNTILGSVYLPKPLFKGPAPGFLVLARWWDG